MAKYTKAQVAQKLKSLGVNRPVTDQDVNNVNTNSMDILDRTFGGSQTPAQAGQAATQSTEPTATTSVPTQSFQLSQSKSAQQQLEELTANGAIAAQLVEEGLNKVKAAAPFEENKQRVRTHLRGLTLNDYKGMPLMEALSAMQKDMAMDQSKVQYFDAKKAEAQAVIDDRVNSFAEILNSQISALGLRVQKEESDRAFAEQQRQFNAQLARQGGQRNTQLRDNADGSSDLLDMNTGDIIRHYEAGESAGGYTPTQTFEDYLQTKQDEAGMSFGNDLIAQTRAEYDKMIAGEKTQYEQQMVSTLSPLTQAVYNNPAGYADLTPTEKGTVQAELQSVGLSPELLGASRADSLRKEYTARPEYKTYLTLRDNYNRIQSSAQDASAAGDLSLIFSYMKMLDPTSVVREGEFATAQTAGGVDDRIRAMYNKVVSGERLSTDQRADFVNRANMLYSDTEKIKSTLDSEYKTLAENAGIDPMDVVYEGSDADSSDVDSWLNSF